MKKILFLLNILFLLLACSSNDKLAFKNYGITEYHSNVKDKVDAKLNLQNCSPYELKSKIGLLIQSDSSVATHYFKGNALWNYCQDTTEKINGSYYIHSFAYLNLNDTTIHILLRLGAQPSSLDILEITQDKDNRFSCDLKYIISEDRILTNRTQRCKLILDKAAYKLGDTIYGYVTYQGLEQSKKKHWTRIKVYFKCPLGVSSNPNDYIDKYEQCD